VVHVVHVVHVMCVCVWRSTPMREFGILSDNGIKTMFNKRGTVGWFLENSHEKRMHPTVHKMKLLFLINVSEVLTIQLKIRDETERG